MARISLLVLLSLVISVCVGQFGTDDVQSVCLYNSYYAHTLKPLQITNANCPANTSYCMNSIYKYGNYQYNGIASLKPEKGEVAIFLSQDQQGKFDLVILLNANVQVTSKVNVTITGADPVPIILYDDPAPTDSWTWNQATNTGNFSWTTQPGYTDGVVIGHINFVDNYCVKTSYTQLSTAINKISFMSGSASKVQRAFSQPYVSGQIFEFCQYPVTALTYTNATCPNSNDGSASIGIVFGPATAEYSWVNSQGVLISQSVNATGLGAGTYKVFVNDPSSDGCNAARTVVIHDNALLAPSVATTPYNCSVRGSAVVTPKGGSGGFLFAWYKSSGGAPIGTGFSILGLFNGDYFVRVTDNCGSVAYANFTIATTGCCGDGICQSNEPCGSSGYCAADCGPCCPAGTVISGDKCRVCPPGTRNNARQSTSCSTCPANTYNAGGNDSCTSCPANYQSSAGSGKCVRCPAGQVRAINESSCQACDAGSFASPCDESSCTSCAAGTIAAAAGASFCTTCPPGTFAPAGGSSCSSCAVGSYPYSSLLPSFLPSLVSLLPSPSFSPSPYLL